jgi:hypothetical protein
MNEKLWWISRHLEHYHFNSNRARALKRDIQQWTTRPTEEQEQTGDQLAQRFDALFCNNPFLEQNGLVQQSDREEGSRAGALVGDITGASADAYFALDNQHYTLRPKVSGRRDPSCYYLDEKAAEQLLKQQQQAAQRELDRYDQFCTDCKERNQKKYSYILSKTVSPEGKGTKKSPTALSALFCLLYYVITVMTLYHGGMFLKAFGLKSDRTVQLLGLPASYLVIAVMALMLLVGLAWIKTMGNTIVKGIYRAYYCRLRFSQYQNRVEYSRMQAKSIQIDEWFRRYGDAINQARAAFQAEPDALPVRDTTRTMLAGTPGRTVGEDLLDAGAPWEKYKTTGEVAVQGTLVLLVLMLLGVLVLTQL